MPPPHCLVLPQPHSAMSLLCAQASYVSLRLTEDLAGFSKYMGFLKQKEPASHHHMINIISCTIKALAFLSSTNKCTAAALVPPKITWLENLKKQLGEEVAKQVKDSHTLLEEGECEGHASHSTVLHLPLNPVPCESTESLPNRPNRSPPPPFVQGGGCRRTT